MFCNSCIKASFFFNLLHFHLDYIIHVCNVSQRPEKLFKGEPEQEVWALNKLTQSQTKRFVSVFQSETFLLHGEIEKAELEDKDKRCLCRL